jgi:CO dehydrogenase/acetyl-CoA synthase beta subunit
VNEIDDAQRRRLGEEEEEEEEEEEDEDEDEGDAIAVVAPVVVLLRLSSRSLVAGGVLLFLVDACCFS